MTITSPCDVLLSDAIEAQVREVMATRAALKRVPGTHAERDDLTLEVDCLLDRWHEVVANG